MLLTTYNSCQFETTKLLFSFLSASIVAALQWYEDSYISSWRSTPSTTSFSVRPPITANLAI